MSYDRFWGVMWGVLAGVCFGLSGQRPQLVVVGCLPIIGAWLMQSRQP